MYLRPPVPVLRSVGGSHWTWRGLRGVGDVRMERKTHLSPDAASEKSPLSWVFCAFDPNTLFAEGQCSQLPGASWDEPRLLGTCLRQTGCEESLPALPWTPRLALSSKR